MLSYKIKLFLKAFLLITLSAVTGSCVPPASKPEVAAKVIIEPSRSDEEDEDRYEDEEDRGRSSSSCRRGETYSDEISISRLKFIDFHNAGEYILKGSCEVEDALIYIKANGYKTSANPKCDRKRWEVELDLTGLFDEEDIDNVVFQITHDGESICKSVRAAFSRPKNYVPVPPLEDYYEDGFYVMKYEAKIEDEYEDNPRAISSHKDSPLHGITHEEALTLCQNNGTRYDLIRNDQWQNIARSIEEVDENWAQGRATPSDDNSINCSRNLNADSASADDEDDCAVSSCDKGWDIDRRTHLLSNGSRIWDICGNVGEMMKDKYRGDLNFDDHVYRLSSTLKRKFGPKKRYSLVNPRRNSALWGLGYAEIDKNHNLIVRGLPGRYSGIFSVNVVADQDSRRAPSSEVGFRCVYVP